MRTTPKTTSKRDGLVVYFNFTNTGSKDTEPIMNRLWFSVGENGEYLRSRVDEPEGVESNAISAYRIAGASNEKTSVGETKLYYAAFKVDKDTDDTVLHINRYDDDFNWTNSITIDIAQTLEEMNSREE